MEMEMEMSHSAPTPTIQISSTRHYDRGLYAIPRRSPAYPSASPASPMAIPFAREAAPPPLPPPRVISQLNEGNDPGWFFANSGPSPSGSIKPGSSLYGGRPTNSAFGSLGGGVGAASSGGAHHPAKRELPADQGEHSTYSLTSSHRRGSSISTSHSASFDHDMNLDPLEDPSRAGFRRPSLADHRLQSERQLGHRSLETSNQAYDRQLLDKIGGPKTDRRPSYLGTNAQEQPASSPHSSFTKLNGQLTPLSVPSKLGYPPVGSPISRWPSSATGSPGFRSPIGEQPSNSTPRRYESSSQAEDGAGRRIQHSYEHNGYPDDFTMDENIRDLNINDRSPPGMEDYQGACNKAGVKRRASSEAARDERSTGSNGGGDLYHRRSSQMLNNRNSPVSRYQGHHGPPSAASSLSQRSTGSYASSYISNLSVANTVASSMTSYSGDQRHSPSGLSPCGEDFGPTSPYHVTPRSLNHQSPRSTAAPVRLPHQRRPSDHDHQHPRKMSIESLAHSRQGSISKTQGRFMCDCCPKKPKAFDCEEELRLHELEKQYTCAYCPNRFKNKNEAERHQNSLHLRRHSWSCAALSGPEAAFHPSTAHPAVADVCGYCGDEFPNPANWEARAEHLNHVHKFGECNQAKKFFRADHFRQHLKHSHAGTSGKWTNMLENACMKDEPLPKERAPTNNPVTFTNATVTTPTSAQMKPGVINEVNEEL